MNVCRRNNVTVLGADAPAMVFAHGYGCDQTAWAEICPAFADHYRLVLFDHVGAGGSFVPAYNAQKYSSLAGYSSDLIEIIEELRLKEVVFVGHSMSSTVGMLAAIERPDLFSALVMICPSPYFINEGDYVGGFSRQDIDELLEVISINFLGWSRAAAPAIMGNPERPELADSLASTFCRTDPAIARQWARVVFLADYRASVPRCATRSLILQTQADVIAPVDVGHYMHANLPDSELYLMRAAGHCPHMSAPQETVDAIRRFLG